MAKAAWLIAVGVAVLFGVGACRSSGNHKHGVEVTVANSNTSDVMIYGCGPCKPARLVGCRNPACPEPKLGDDPSGNVFGWTETRRLPREYRMVLLSTGKNLQCPPATPAPPHSVTDSYAVVYDITPSGRCLVVSHSPLN